MAGNVTQRSSDYVEKGHSHDDKAEDSPSDRNGPRRIGETPRAIRMRPRAVHGDRQRALRAAPDFRQRPATDRSRPTRTIRGLRSLRAGYPLAALAAHGGYLRAREPQARVLSLDGVPHRP